MINTEPIHINKWLLPFSWLYGIGVYIRNKFFDWGIFKREEFDVPVICIGNITVGGTGKTPHTEYLINVLKDKYRVGVLSRGYKRKSKGFVLATSESTSLELGDESYQIKRKFPDVIVAVDGNRRRGIKEMLSLENPPEVILLDDAFQHRYVKPSYTVILSDFNRPVYEDTLLPAGRLRESPSHLRDANIIIVTKCPEELQPIDFRIISHDINAFPYQGLYFTQFSYNNLKPVFGNGIKQLPLDSLQGKSVLLATGIASPDMIIKKLSDYTKDIDMITYPDHHNFRVKDIRYISERFKGILSDNKIIIVTEKDAARLVLREDIDEEIKESLYYLPVEITFMSDENDFKDKILKHVRENTGNRKIYKR
ncbi:tetraacyldisaccharide 4'-kinase [Dysgonomonas hofstadii]|uniref:Tetraacyldisaccharide 4'-kinase n=1 Tax=Dysgonomonas hofstadii TaxID=637886 RepID=A0A840CDQ9_9BACT|nr:tetraacyldisaccharide 4'-kinase [Dysgonomonas hofstadii]MBB4034117.1 tetraacyldisaccharide 4'-kinase [Dysgonomonas hofstadii]